MKYLLEHSCRIPEQMAIVGYDDIDAASLVTPALTHCPAAGSGTGPEGSRDAFEKDREKGRSGKASGVEAGTDHTKNNVREERALQYD